jgi:hypothetical protein
VPASRIETRSVRSEPGRTSAGKAARESWAARRDTPRAATPAAAPRTPAATDSGRDRSYGANRSASNAGQPSWAERRGLPDQRSTTGRDGRDGRGADRSGNWNGGRDGDRDRDGDRRGNWGGRDGNRDGSWDRDHRGRDGNWDRDHRGRDGDRDHRRWDNRWRDNNRYDWHRYRDSNRTVFHLGLYYAPYRNYSYSRIGVGFYLDSLFFGSRYWIADPWTYRLPEVYGPYRWVRYYDDVVLVDIYTGEVVDVIYDFFW